MTLEREENDMATDNQGSRTFLAIVLSGIVLALVIAAYFMYGSRHDAGMKADRPAVTEPAPAPAAPPMAVPQAPSAETPAAPAAPPANNP
jgi:hypothetical protein